MTLNRSQEPEIQIITHLDIPPGEKITTPNGIDIHIVKDITCDVLKIEFVFDAGFRVQGFPYQATASSAILIEGTSKNTSKELAEKLDYYGAYLQNRAGHDDASLTLYCLPKHAASCIPYLMEILSLANYPESEIETQKQNAKQRLLVNENKTSFLARRAFYETIFGKQNPYGASVNQTDIENISRETLLGFYTGQYLNKAKYVLVSGNVSDSVISILSKALAPFTHQKTKPLITRSHANPPNKLFIHKDGAVQSAIRIGRAFVNRQHPDYRKMQVLNLALGGYFGSRLMTNIREEKGLTYGIYSAVESYLYAGAFYIDTDINNKLVGNGVAEIYKEIGLLREKPIEKAELETVKSYMLGSFLRSLDGPFSLADRYKILIDYELSQDYYSEFVEIIQTTNALTLQELANKYLQETDLYEVIVGEK